jgi:hypothetical protein
MTARKSTFGRRLYLVLWLPSSSVIPAPGPALGRPEDKLQPGSSGGRLILCFRIMDPGFRRGDGLGWSENDDKEATLGRRLYLALWLPSRSVIPAPGSGRRECHCAQRETALGRRG